MTARRPWTACLLIALFLAALCPRWGALALLQQRIDLARTGLLEPPNLSPRDRLVELGSTVMLGSFRTVAVNILWYKAEVLKDRREWIELEGVIKLIARFQPTDIDAYDHQAWNMAYNIQYDAPTAPEGWKWVKRGIDFAEQGIARNPNHPQVWKLYWRVAWTFFDRCATNVGERTAYFAQQAEKDKDFGGKNVYLIAADWFKKAWEAGIRPGATKVNAQWLSMWAYAYDDLAKQCAKEGNLDAMLKYRKMAIGVHELIMNYERDGVKLFPGYQPNAERLVGELRDLMALYRRQQEIEALPASTPVAKQAELLIALARDWAERLRALPEVPEAQRNVDRVADELTALAERAGDPQLQSQLMEHALATRYEAANPERGSREAADRLETALAPYDRSLHSLEALGPKQLADQVTRVALVARCWTRIIQNTPHDDARVAKAEAAIGRYDSLVPILTPEQRASAIPELTDEWRTLITLTGIDSKVARARVRNAAFLFERQFMASSGEAVALLGTLKQIVAGGAPPAEQEKVVARLFALKPVLYQSASGAIRQWTALLRRDASYAEDARLAEEHLQAIMAEMERAVEAGLDQVRHPRDFRKLSNVFESVWRSLHEFNPRNVIYLQKLRELAKKKQQE